MDSDSPQNEAAPKRTGADNPLSDPESVESVVAATGLGSAVGGAIGAASRGDAKAFLLGGAVGSILGLLAKLILEDQREDKSQIDPPRPWPDPEKR